MAGESHFVTMSDGRGERVKRSVIGACSMGPGHNRSTFRQQELAEEPIGNQEISVRKGS